MFTNKHKPLGSLRQLMLLLNTVGLSTESLIEDSSINFSFLLHMQKHILQNALSNQNYEMPSLSTKGIPYIQTPS